MGRVECKEVFETSKEVVMHLEESYTFARFFFQRFERFFVYSLCFCFCFCCGCGCCSFVCFQIEEGRKMWCVERVNASLSPTWGVTCLIFSWVVSGAACLPLFLFVFLSVLSDCLSCAVLLSSAPWVLHVSRSAAVTSTADRMCATNARRGFVQPNLLSPFFQYFPSRL